MPALFCLSAFKHFLYKYLWCYLGEVAPVFRELSAFFFAADRLFGVGSPYGLSWSLCYNSDAQLCPICTARPTQRRKAPRMGIELTETAASEIKTIIGQQELDDEKVRLRVGVKGGGCSGFSYLLDLTEQQSDNDEAFDQHGITVVCDPKSFLYLNGTTIDFKDEVMGRGFVFSNPNATSSCGCGSSFSA